MLFLLFALKLTVGPVSPIRTCFSPSSCLSFHDPSQFPKCFFVSDTPLLGILLDAGVPPGGSWQPQLPSVYLYHLRCWSNLSSCDNLSSASTWGNGPPFLWRAPCWGALHVLSAQVTALLSFNSSDVWIILNTKKKSFSIWICWLLMQISPLHQKPLSSVNKEN